MSSITLKDRHEVAERLRRLTSSKHDQDYKPRYTDICTAIGGKKGYWLGISALAERLADLIDPTCHQVIKDETQVCSVCSGDLDGEYGWDFCPWCGSRVLRMPRSIARVVLPPYKPTYNELYLKALEIRGNYIAKAAQVGLKTGNSPLTEEMEEAVKHYKKLAWEDSKDA